MYYFQLLPRKALGTSDCRRAPPHIMKIFARLSSSEPSTIHEIHAFAAIKMNQN